MTKPAYINECEFCGWKTQDLHEAYPPHGVSRSNMYYLCTICYSTPAGNACMYEHIENKDLFRTIAWIGNAILTQLKPNE